MSQAKRCLRECLCECNFLPKESFKVQDCWWSLLVLRCREALCIKWLQLALADKFSPLNANAPSDSGKIGFYFTDAVWIRKWQQHASWHFARRARVQLGSLVAREETWLLSNSAALNCITQINQRDCSEWSTGCAFAAQLCTCVCGDGNNNNSASPPVIH